MAHPVVHAEIRSQDPDATRRFFADLFGWKIASGAPFPATRLLTPARRAAPLSPSARARAPRTKSCFSSPSRTSKQRWPEQNS
jgi:catechol 2,3-dioxygenase-like lactoylglutathione lyase family enzyme